MRIVDTMPEGYRWATELETEAWAAGGALPGAVQVRVGGTDDEPWTDIAVPFHAVRQQIGEGRHRHQVASEQPLMWKCGGHTWHLLRADGTDETDELHTKQEDQS